MQSSTPNAITKYKTLKNKLFCVIHVLNLPIAVQSVAIKVRIIRITVRKLKMELELGYKCTLEIIVSGSGLLHSV